LNTKNVLILVVLSAGILTALTGTGISQVAPAYADKEECEDNDDNNCNERTHKIKQDDDCKAENEYEKIGSMDNPTDNNQFTCDNILTSPANGDDNELDDENPPTENTGTLIVTINVICATATCAFEPDDFTILVTGDVQSSVNPFPGSAAGTEVTLGPGSYSVTETDPIAGVTHTVDATCSGNINAGETINCLITNTLPANAP
jgi:hypothetical protein